MSPELSMIVTHLWQSTVFTGIAWFATVALRANSARVRYWLWTAASLKFFVPVTWLVSMGAAFQWRSAPPMIKVTPAASFVIEQILTPATFAPVAAPAVPAAAQTFHVLPVVLALIWLAGTTAVLTWWWRQWRIVRSAVRNAAVVDLSPACDTGGILTVTSPLALEPGVVGIRRPVLMLPEGLADRLTHSQLRALVAHESCHIRCRDNLTALLHMLVEAVFWFHPLVWWIESRMIAEREHACDEAVLCAGNDPEDYAEGLLEVCRSSMASPLSCVAGVGGSNLRGRVQYILQNEPGQPLTVTRRLTLALTGALCLTLPVLAGVLAAETPLVAIAPPSVVLLGVDRLGRSVPRSSDVTEEQSGQAAVREFARGQRPAELTLQNDAQRLAFDVVSIKPNQTLDPNTAVAQVRPQFEVAAIRPMAERLSGDFVLGLNAKGAQVHIAWASLLDLVNMAYRLKRYQISGPPWLGDDHFTVDAKIPDGFTTRDVPEMLRHLLDTRFGMKSHWEKKEFPVYTLGLSKPEPNLREVAAPDDQLSFPIGNINGASEVIDFGGGGTFTFGDNMLDAKKLNLNQFAEWFSNLVDRPVVNETGLKGFYDFQLKLTPRDFQTMWLWAVVNGSGKTLPLGALGGDALSLESLPNALKNLGFKLERGKGLLDVLVIDAVQPKPTEN